MSDTNINEREIDFSAIGEALFRRKKIIFFTSSLALTSSLILTTLFRKISPIYSGNFVFLVNNPLEDRTNENQFPGQESTGVFNNLLSTNPNRDIPTLIELLKGPAFLEPFAEKNDLSPTTLSRNLEITTEYKGGFGGVTSKGSIKVEYRARNPDKTLKILNNLKDFYLDVALQERRKELVNGIKFLDQQGPVLEKKAEKLQDQLAAFRIKNNLVDPIPESSELKQRLEKLETDIVNTENKGIRFSEIKNEIKLGKLNVGGFNEVIDSGIVRKGMRTQGGMSVKDSDSSFLQKTLELENELAKARTKFLPSSKTVKNLEKKLKLLEPEIKRQQLESLDMSISLNKSKLESLRNEREEVNKKFLKQANLIEPFEYITQSLETARANQLDLINTKEKFLLELAQKRNNWRVLQNPSVKNYPIRPSYLVNILIGLIGGSFLGIILALYRDSKDNVFHSKKEIEETNLTILGHIPYTEIFDELKNEESLIKLFINLNKKSNKKDCSNNYEKFLYQESFRNLFTSIKFIGSEKPLKTIALTSAESGEGKSLISIMLSKTLCDIDQNILLIDCDMRKPQLDKRLNLNNLKGLTNILTEKDGIQNWGQFVQDIPNHEKWKIITCGTVPPDPTRIISSNKMKEFVNLLNKEDKYDLIIFDTPPAGGLSDASLVGSLCDGLIVVVSINKVDKEIFAGATNKLSNLGSKVLGLVTNECSKPKQKDQQNSYQYKDVYDIAENIKDDEINQESTYIINNKYLKIVKKYYKKLNHWLDN